MARKMMRYESPHEVVAWIHMSNNGTVKLLNLGCETGMQAAVDVMCLVLNEKYGFGKDRLKKVIDSVNEMMNENISIWRTASLNRVTVDDESGVLRQKLDDRLDQIFQRERGSMPFSERYPILRDRL